MVDMLLEVFFKALPLFLGILAGFIASFWSRFQSSAEPPISAFTFYIALPSLLFVVTSEADLRAGIPLAFSALVVTVTAVFCLLIFPLLWILSRKDLNGSISATLAASYGNVAYLGIPVVLGVLGPVAGLPAVIAQLLHNLIFVLGYPVSQQLLSSTRAAGESRWKAAAATMGRTLLGSPLIWAVALGATVSLTEVHVFGPLMDFVNMLSAAAAPTALFAIGLTLRGAATALRGGGLRLTPVFVASTGKLLLLPAVTAAVAFVVAPDMGSTWLVTMVLMAGMPTSATAFVLATTSRGDGKTVAAVILVTNFLGIVTLPVAASLFI